MEEEIKKNLNKFGYPALSFILPFIIYLLTAPKDLTNGIFGSDSGELITASVTGGIPHPPGYPTWLIATRFFTQLPIGQTLAHRFNLFSVVCMSCAIMILYLSARKYLKPANHLPILASVFTVALTLTVWSQAVITEVYALNSLMLSGALYLLVTLELANDRPLSVWQVGATGLMIGLAATTHLTSVFLLPLALLTLRKQLHLIPVIGAGVALGLSPLLFLFLGGDAASPIVWGDPTSVEGWWWLVSGQVYSGAVLSLSLPEAFDRLQQFFRLSEISPGILIPFAVLIGLILEVTETDNRPKLLFPLGCTAIAVLYAIYSFTYDTGDWRVFILPANLMLSLPLAYGLNQFDGWSLLVPLLFLAIHLPVLREAQTDNVRAEGMQVLEQAPQNAILLTDGRDATLFPMWYFRYAEEQRPDTTVVDFNLLAFDWYRDRLQVQNPSLAGLDIDDVERFKRLNQSNRPICEISLQPFALSCTDG